MELANLVLAIVAATFIGFNVLYLILNRFEGLYFYEAIFISYGIGLGCISLEMLMFYMVGIKFSVPAIVLPWSFIFAINLFRYIKAGGRLVFLKDVSHSPEGNRYLNIFLVAGITIETVYAFFRALIKPIESYDAIAIYAIKSKIFFLAGSIPQNYFSTLIQGFPHPDYPLNIPLVESFLYLAMRHLNEELVKIIFPLFFLGILCILYFAIRRFASRTYSLVFTFLLASIPQFNAYAANAYQELPLAFYYLVSAVFLFIWIDDKDNLRALSVSAVMVALAAWTKNEGLLYCVINTILVLGSSVLVHKGASRKSVYASVLYMGIIALIVAPWIWIKHTYGIVNDEINLANLNPVYLVKQLPKLGPIFYELQKQLFGPKKWNILWIVVIAVSIFNFRKLFSGVQKYVSISLVLAFCGYIIFYMISYVDVVFFASKTWSRFLLHFLPLVVLWLAYILKEDIKL